MSLRLRGVLFEALGRHGSRVSGTFDVEWTQDAVAEVFPELTADDKDGVRLWAAASYRIGANRGLAGLEQLYAAVIDADCCDVGEMDRAREWLTERGLAHVCYTSWSHRDPAKLHKDTGKSGPFDAFRLIVPFDKPVTPDEYRALVPALFGHELPADPPHYYAEVLGRWVETASGTERAARPRGFDPASSRPAQSYYVPVAHPSRAEHAVLDVVPGIPLDVEAVLRRPTTARVSNRAQRAYQRPTAEAVGALRDVERALAGRGVGMGSPGFEGWRRAPCPSCAPDGVQKSPSFRARSNGETVDLQCFAGCTRRDILNALGLEATGRFAPPSELEVRLSEQLSRQGYGDAVPVDEAVKRLVVDIRDAVNSREPTVIQYPAGTGKSYASAIVLTERARAGYRICYSTQEHRVAHETREYLPADVKSRSVHLHSPLLQVGNDPVCARAGELKERVFDFGVSLMKQVCPRCPLRDTCEALTATKDRFAAAKHAAVLFVTHAGIDQVFGLDSEGVQKGNDIDLIVDEMPGAFERVEVTPSQLKTLATTELPSVQPTLGLAIREVARAWSSGQEPGDVTWGPGGRVLGSALGILSDWGRLTMRDDAHPTPQESQLLKVADNLVRLAANREAVYGLQNQGHTELAAMLPDACHAALVRRQGVLLSATPMLAALPGFTVRACAVTDGAKVRRVMVLRGGRGSKAMTQSYWDDALGIRVRRDRQPGEASGIAWPVVMDAIDRARAEAERYECKRVLLVTFKAVADEVRKLGLPDLEVAHYGALRGKNDWMEGRASECSVIYCLGTPRFAVMPTLIQLGLTGEAADQAWVAFAGGELEQAEGRLRLPRRTKPCSVVVEGDVAPLSWTADSIDELNTHDEVMSERHLHELAMFWRPSDEVDALLADGEPARELAFPPISEALRLMAQLSPARQALLDGQFSWASAD